MFVIRNKTMKLINGKFQYIGEEINSNFVQLTNKENARRFETEEEAKSYMKQNKIKDGELELLWSTILWEE